MNTIARIIVFSLCLLSLYSCKTEFTHSFRNVVESKNAEAISKIQFYNSKTIKCVNESTEQDHKIKRGKVNYKEGVYTHYLKIARNTKCKAESVAGEPRALKVFFGSGDEDYLVFRAFDKKNKYQLAGFSKNDSFYVSYSGKEYAVSKGGKATLKYKEKASYETQDSKEKVKGVKVK